MKKKPDYISPTGDVSLTLGLTSDGGELPTLLKGNIKWGQGQVSHTLNFSDQTAPGSSGNVTETFLNSYKEAGVYTVDLVLGNAISSITFSGQVCGCVGVCGGCGGGGGAYSVIFF